MAGILFLAALTGAGFAAYEALHVALVPDGAPQQAARMAMAIGWAVIPYVAARSMEAIEAIGEKRKAQRVAEGKSTEVSPFVIVGLVLAFVVALGLYSAYGTGRQESPAKEMALADAPLDHGSLLAAIVADGESCPGIHEAHRVTEGSDIATVSCSDGSRYVIETSTGRVAVSLTGR